MGETYAAIIKALHKALDGDKHYGREGRHAFGVCPTCHIHCCLTHHFHP